MSTFKFNFSNDTESAIEDTSAFRLEIQWIECEEVQPDYQIENFDKIVNHARLFLCNDLAIGHVLPNEVFNNMNKNNIENGIVLANQQHSDLITGKYEGGLKVWECTNDLMEYLLQNMEAIKWKSAHILDLGCGAGLLGILAVLNNSFVTFQDYNKEVIECVTIPNVLLNFEEDERSTKIKKCKFYSGDWASFTGVLESTGAVFDYIFTSETIYNSENYMKLINLFSKTLKDNGVIFLAAKTYYFGIGGGTRQFESCLNSNRRFKYETCWKSAGGIQREILRITKS